MSVESGYRVVCNDCGEELVGFDGRNAWANEDEAIEAAAWSSWRIAPSNPDAHCVCAACHEGARPYQNHHRVSQALKRVRKRKSTGATLRDTAKWIGYAELALAKIESGTTYVPDDAALDIIRELSDRMKPKHMTITLCGSARFEGWFRAWETALSLLGHTVLSLSAYPSDFEGEKLWYTDEEKRVMDEVNKRKIDASDGILVLNVAGYIGESTLSEIEHARLKHKKVWFLEKQPKATIRRVAPGSKEELGHDTVVRALNLEGHQIPIDTTKEAAARELLETLSASAHARIMHLLALREDRCLRKMQRPSALELIERNIRARQGRFKPEEPLKWDEADDDGFSIAYHGDCMLAVSPTEKEGEWTAELSIFIPANEGISVHTKTFSCNDMLTARKEAEQLRYRDVAIDMEENVSVLARDLLKAVSELGDVQRGVDKVLSRFDHKSSLAWSELQPSGNNVWIARRGCVELWLTRRSPDGSWEAELFISTLWASRVSRGTLVETKSFVCHSVSEAQRIAETPALELVQQMQAKIASVLEDLVQDCIERPSDHGKTSQ